MIVQKIHLLPINYTGLFRLISIFAGWVAGTVAGVLVFNANIALFLSLLSRTTTNPVSVSGMLISIIIPFTITEICLRKNAWPSVFVLAFIEALSYSVCSAAVYSLYGSAGWLAQFLLLFSQNASVVLLIVLWLDWLHRSTHQTRFVYVSIFAALVCVAVDILLISPICVSVFTI